MTGCDPWYDRGERRPEEDDLDWLIGSMYGSRGSAFGAPEPQALFGKPLGPWYSAGRAPVGACPYCSHGDPHGPLNGLRPDDIDTIIARLLEGYRILDELFNPRSDRRKSTPKNEYGPPETHAMPNDRMGS